MTEMVAVDDIVCAADIAKLFDVGQSAVSNWRKRDLGFPEPFTTIATRIALWRKSEVESWYETRWRPYQRKSLEDRIAQLESELSQARERLEER